MSEIVKALAAVMGEVGSVRKGDRNQFHGYDYTGTDDVAHAVQSLLAKNGVVIIQTEATEPVIHNGLATIKYRFFLLHSSGETLSSVEGVPFVHTGVAQATNSKGGMDDKAGNKCHTAARKYFLIALFQLPRGKFDDPDADEDRAPPKAAQEPRQARARPVDAPPPSPPPPEPETPATEPRSEPQHVDTLVLRWPDGMTRDYRRTPKGGKQLLTDLLSAVTVNRGMMDLEDNQMLVASMTEDAEKDERLAGFKTLIDAIHAKWLAPMAQP